MRFFQKPYRWAITFTLILIISSTYVMLDTFVIPRIGTAVVSTSASASTETEDAISSDTGSETDTAEETEAETEAETETTDTTATDDTANTDTDTAESTAVITDTSYSDDSMQITIETLYVYDTMVYVVDIQLSDASDLQTAFANSTYGRNIKQTTSDMAEDNDAILAINGDYYGFRNDGYVIRNGILYRDTSGDNEDLVIDSDGNFSIINESEVTAESLLEDGAWQVLSFGPALVIDGEIAVTEDDEVSQSMTSNPRTAIGQVGELHYIIIVSDGRSDESEGLSLLELAELFEEYGCTVAYNLDGGGSSTLWFNGEVINNPTDGRSDGERKVSDIVYIN